MKSLDNLLLFAEVVNQGSYTQAAIRLGLSKAHLSQQVKQLESHLGKPLLVRNTRNMRLTSAGQLLYNQAQKLQGFWQQTTHLLEEEQQGLEGVIRCTAPVAVANYLLQPLFNDFIKQHPGIELIINTGNTTHNLTTDNFDFAIRLTNTPPDDMVARHLCQVDYICCCSPEYARQNQLPQTPEQLRNSQCLVLSHWPKWSFGDGNNSSQISPASVYQATDNQLLKQACLQGLGIARLPNYMLQQELADGSLLPVLTDFQCDLRQLYLLYPQLSSRPQRVKLLLQYIQQHIAP